MEWLEVNGPDRSWTFVWRQLFAAAAEEREKARISEIGFSWLEDNEDHAGWGVVWIELWNAELSPNLEELALTWLNGTDVNREGFGMVWCCLWDSGYRTPEFEQLGEVALRRMSPSLKVWPRVLSRLVREGRSDELWEVGMAWAERTGIGDRAWGIMLPALMDGASEREDAAGFEVLLGTGRDFLREADPTHPSWSLIFCAIWDGEDSELRGLAQEWIEDLVDVRTDWNFVWERLWDTDSDERLASLALLWLRNNMGVKRWSHVWTRLGNEEMGAYLPFDLDELLDLGEVWLAENPPGDLGWSYVFRILWERRPSEAVRKLGMEWLARTKGGYEPAWDRIWALLWESRVDKTEMKSEGLRRLGIEWLECSDGHQHWPTVWIDLWDAGPDERLRKLGDAWTRGRGQGNPGRKVVIARLVTDEQVAVEEKKELARQSRSNGGWANPAALRQAILKQREDAISTGLDRIRAGPASGAQKDQIEWKKLWAILWKVRPSIELRSIAIGWLEAPAATDARGRGEVWERLWRAEPSRDSVCDRMRLPRFSARQPLQVGRHLARAVEI